MFECMLCLITASLVLGEPAGAQGKSPPRLLPYVPGAAANFVVRPPFMSFQQGYLPFDFIGGAHSTATTVFQPKDRIRWRRWGQVALADAAYYRATCLPSCSATSYKRDRVTLRAYRVRDDHYTRFSITYSWGATEVFALRRTRVNDVGLRPGTLVLSWCFAQEPARFGCTPP